MKVVSVVGMTGAGKSAVSRFFEDNGFVKIRFGDVTDDEVRRRGLELNEENERQIRELLRKKYGMSAYAILNLPKIESAHKQSDVVVDGLYSWEEYTFLKSQYGSDFYVVAVWASPATRYNRLASRLVRRLTLEEAVSRDKAEVENLNKGGPIAVANFTLINESSLKDLKKEVERVISKLRGSK
ncbi:MAG: AAA family ATPase [Dehalococcoidales bacterium]|nr:AAA family ATPase [Dehalococcoidales bacterium]